MALKYVKFVLDGQTYDLSYDEGSGQWKGTITAPSKSSFPENEDHKFHGTVNVEDLAGNQSQATVDQFPELGLRVLEKTAPVISVTYPTDSALISTPNPTIQWTVTDDGSGIKKDTIKLQIGSQPEITTGINTVETAGGWTCTYTPAAPLDDGAHTIRFFVEDNDGNLAPETSVSVTVDTVPPTLNVTSPEDNLITNNPTLTVAGTTSDTTSSPVTVEVKVGAGEFVPAQVQEGGAFSVEVSLVEGLNTVTVKATDRAGKSTTVERSVTLKTNAPQVTSVSLVPNPVDAGQTYVITVTVTE